MHSMPPEQLSRRERQIMDIVYARGQATAAEVTAALPDAPSYSAVRALLRILEQKGHLRHQQDGPRYVFLPTVSRATGRDDRRCETSCKTFFDGSTAQAAAALIDQAQLSDEEFDRLAEAIEKARTERSADAAIVRAVDRNPGSRVACIAPADAGVGSHAASGLAHGDYCCSCRATGDSDRSADACRGAAGNAATVDGACGTR